MAWRALLERPLAMIGHVFDFSRNVHVNTGGGFVFGFVAGAAAAWFLSGRGTGTGDSLSYASLKSTWGLFNYIAIAGVGTAASPVVGAGTGIAASPAVAAAMGVATAGAATAGADPDPRPFLMAQIGMRFTMLRAALAAPRDVAAVRTLYTPLASALAAARLPALPALDALLSDGEVALNIFWDVLMATVSLRSRQCFLIGRHAIRLEMTIHGRQAWPERISQEVVDGIMAELLAVADTHVDRTRLTTLYEEAVATERRRGEQSVAGAIIDLLP